MAAESTEKILLIVWRKLRVSAVKNGVGMMWERPPNYAAARGYLAFFSFIGWALIVIGLIVAVVALGGSSGGRRGSELALLGLVPAFLLVLGGFMTLVAVQLTAATLDASEISWVALDVSRKQLANASQTASGVVSGNRSEVHESSASTFTASKVPGAMNRVKVYRGFAIDKERSGVSVEGRPFDTVLDAEKFIDERLTPSE